jgi:hypothetical protein
VRKRGPILSALVLLAALPLAGGAWRGFPDGFFSFPPLVASQPAHAPFSWPIFAVVAAIALLAGGILFIGFRPPRPCTGPRPPRACTVGKSGPTVPPPPTKYPFPLHGRFGFALLLVSWFFAWSRLDLPGIAEQHTFFPLWLGFIFFLDGLVYRRAGRSLFASRRRAFVLLFPVSALSWWYFEFLNRFVRNWWYPDRLDFGPGHYLVYSSLCFSTVLPAIFEIRALLMTVPALRRRWSHGPRVRLPHVGAAAFFLGAGLLPLIPLYPDPLFFAVWIAPLALLAGALGLARVESPFAPVRTGNWTPLLSLALAALVCGFFWELWNAFSSPRWAYAVPYVYRFRLFAMPAVGYAGYLPFGPVCACFWLAWTGLLRRRGAGAGVQDLAGSDLLFLNPEP